ncbi:DUF547 domain-containing protein [Salinispirillum sp. LH 10-3-1]|uniref:DUF547 domain-containing protein n=1 Tax=Salinispirillum sp. LH 10-3-1 TaxID=2952525 RepID=A0AB38YCZ8_9GAMM
MKGRIFALFAGAVLSLFLPLSALAFDHSPWTALLQKHVVPFNENRATAVDYAGFANDRAELTRYLSSLSAVTEAEFDEWSGDEQLAFLINVYNAWTVELILTRYPDLDSIRELGSFLRSPWKQRFIPLFGAERTLDEVEHDMIRGESRDYAGYDEPRIHFAVNCASIGCPALLTEAFTGADLEDQLDRATRWFLNDKTRNRWADGSLEVSSIFRWYRSDFEAGWGGAESLGAFLALYADELGVPTDQRAALTNDNIRIRFLDYDWALNDVKGNSIANMPRED